MTLLMFVCHNHNYYVFPMMFYSNERNQKLTFRYYNKMGEEIDLLETITFIPNMHINNVINPYIMTNEHPLTYSLSNAYPNPFNPSTKINYSIADDINNLQINVYDIQGRLVETLHKGMQPRGEYQLVWNASNFSSGIYFLRMLANQHLFTKKVILIK